MPVDSNRPVHLNLIKIRLPIAGVMSIMHRLSGLFLALGTPTIIYLLKLSLEGDKDFDQAKSLLQDWPFKLVLFLLFWALLHHLLAGIRYLLLDLDICIAKPGYRFTAWGVTLLAPAMALAVMEALS